MKQLKLIVTALFLISPFAANADLVFSDLSYTSNSFTFTVDGTLTGGTSGYAHSLSIQYLGDIFNDLPGTVNTWSTSVFDGLSFALGRNFDLVGNTATFRGAWGYSWWQYSSVSHGSVDLSGAVATNRTITLTMGDNYLNTATTNGSFRFVWGNGHSLSPSRVLASFDARSLVAVPEPGTLALLGLGLAGMGMTRRKKKV